MLAEAARSKEDIEAAEEQLQKFPQKETTSLSISLQRICLLRKGDLDGAGERSSSKRSLSILNRPPAHMAMGDLYLIPERI